MSTPNIEVILQGVNCARSIINLLKTSEDVVSDTELTTICKVCAIGTRALGVVFSTYETNATFHHVPSEELMKIKGYEILEKTAEFTAQIPLLMSRASRRYDQNKKTDHSETFLSMGAAGVDIFRLMAEMGILTQRHYLEMSPEERSKIRIPIWYGDEIVGEKPVDTDECLRIIDDLENFDATVTAWNAFMESRFPYDVPRMLSQAHAIVRQDFQNPNVGALATQRRDVQDNPFARLATLKEEQINQNIEDLLSLSYIPPHLYEEDNDSVFKKYECCISFMPARHPVQDPTATGTRKVVYDEICILEYLKHLSNQGLPMKSPVTQRPLDPRDLIPMIGAQRLINEKLKTFQSSWTTILTRRPELRGIPTDVNLKDIVEAAAEEIGML